VPAADLSNQAQRARLSALRDEGAAITVMWIWSELSEPAEVLGSHRNLIDAIEIQVPGMLYPTEPCLASIARCVDIAPITLAPLLPREVVAGKQHARTRIGFHLDELEALDQHLRAHGTEVNRALCRVDAGQEPWQVMFAQRQLPPLRQVAAIDWACEFADADSEGQPPWAAAAMAAMACLPGSRLFLEPLIDFDRTMDTPPGLLDRLCNPRPVFHVVRTLNTVLFSGPAGWEPEDGAEPSLRRKGERLALHRAGGAVAPPEEEPGADTSVHVIDLAAATSREATGGGELPPVISLVRTSSAATITSSGGA
jgi:hypothetical protein